MNRYKIPNGGQKRTLLGGPKERKARKACQKGNDGFQKGGFRPYQPDNGAGKDFLQNKGRGKEGMIHKGNSQRRRIWPRLGNQTTGLPAIGLTSPGLQLLDSERKAHSAWMVATPLNLANHPTHVVLDLGCTRSIGSRSAIERFKKHAWYYGITTEFCRCNKSFVFANSETETCMESCMHCPLSNNTTMFYQG